VTARKMKYFEERHHDSRADRRSQLMMFVSFVNEFRTAKEHPLGKGEVHSSILCGSTMI
jgi:hypothetical protein